MLRRFGFKGVLRDASSDCYMRQEHNKPSYSLSRSMTAKALDTIDLIRKHTPHENFSSERRRSHAYALIRRGG